MSINLNEINIHLNPNPLVLMSHHFDGPKPSFFINRWDTLERVVKLNFNVTTILQSGCRQDWQVNIGFPNIVPGVSVRDLGKRQAKHADIGLRVRVVAMRPRWFGRNRVRLHPIIREDNIFTFDILLPSPTHAFQRN
jgi:hypothetical protein